MTRRARAAPAIVALVAAWLPARGLAQTLAPPTPALTGGDVGLVHLEARAGSPALALVLALPSGSADDPPGLEGVARVLAGTVARTISEAVGSASVITEIDVGPHGTRIRAIALADRWRETWTALEDAAFGSALDDGLVTAEKADLEETLVFSSGAPHLDVLGETRRLLFGESEARPPDGTIETVRALGAADVEAFRRTHYRRDDAALVLVGALDEATARRELGLPSAATQVDAAPDADSLAVADSLARGEPPALPGDPVADATPAEPGQDSAPWGGSLPWSAGDRVRIAQEVTSTWIAVAYPAPAEMPTTLLEALAHRLTEALNPTPNDPGLFSARVRVDPVRGGRALLIEAAVLPDAADRWESRILATVEGLATPLQADFFRWQRRRFRSAVLLRDATPEGAADRRVDDLMEAGHVRDLVEAVWALDAEGFARGASSLGPPRILVYGPDLAGS